MSEQRYWEHEERQEAGRKAAEMDDAPAQTLIERLEHFKKHQLEQGDEYGAEVLHRAIEALNAHVSLQQENERLKFGIRAIVDGEEYYKGLANAEDYDSNIEDICSNLSVLLAGGE